MQKLLFELRDLFCGYPDRGKVLNIENLAIYSEELVFMIGVSGIGKSTLIESLGLMNKTLILNQGGVANFHNEDGNTTQLVDLWDTKKNSLNSFRRNNYSFLFQENNLMPHFTAGENMILSQLIKGIEESEAMDRVLELMTLLKLDRSLYNEKVYKLSGGQRQRVSFIRAISAPFKALFADEPTGNLDATTSRILFQILADQLKLNKQTGIIVTHDLKLALEFGTRICPIEVINGDGRLIGRIDDMNNLIRKGQIWTDKTGNEIPDAYGYLHDFLMFSEVEHG